MKEIPDLVSVDRLRRKAESGNFKKIESDLGIDLHRWKGDFSDPIVATYTYVYRFNCKYISDSLSMHIDYAKSAFAEFEVVHFVDGSLSMTALSKIKKLAGAGLMRAFVLRDAGSCPSLKTVEFSDLLRELKKSGAELHFSDASPLNEFLNFSVVSAEIAARRPHG